MRNKLVIFYLFAFNVLPETLLFSEDIPPALSDKELLITEEASDTIREEIRWLQAESEVTIATWHKTTTGKAPSIVTVITAEEIKNLGFRTFIAILRTVPGFEIQKRPSTFGEVPIVRGFDNPLTNPIRLMINGHFVNDPGNGGAFHIFSDLPVENIERIEIIRGPGSALYGENAFSAVINIITKDPGDIEGVRVSSGYGSFDTYDENIVFGKMLGDFGISGTFHYRQTVGFDAKIERDLPSLNDDILVPLGFSAASEAPGTLHDSSQVYDLNLRVTYKDISFEGWYRNKRWVPFLSNSFALTDDSQLEYDYFFAEARYKKTFEERFTLKSRVYFDQFKDDSFIELFPEGTTLPFDADGDGNLESYPDGQLLDLRVTERTVGAEIHFDYEVFDSNIFTLGTEYRLINQTDGRAFFNADLVTGKALDSLQEIPDELSGLADYTRRIWSVYLQDTWEIIDTVNLTLGVRHDQYSDFGGTTNPRAGLTWEFMQNASLKFLYGEAFRPPNFREELFIRSKSLEPETIRTYEVGLSYQFNKHVSSSVNYFNNRINDLITTTEIADKTFIVNAGDARVQGIEMETKVDITKGSYLFMNYTFQDTEDDDGNSLPFVAKHHGNFGININYPKYINTNLYTYITGKRSRESDDTRDDLPGFALLNLSVTGKKFFKTMEVQGTVFNLLDKDYSDPGFSFMPEDIPRPGRTFFIGLSCEF